MPESTDAAKLSELAANISIAMLTTLDDSSRATMVRWKLKSPSVTCPMLPIMICSSLHQTVRIELPM